MKTCPACLQNKIEVVKTVYDHRFWCVSCHHSWQLERSQPNYNTQSTNPQYSEARATEQIAFFAPFLGKQARVLEIGCGDGSLGKGFLQQSPSAEYDGLELSPAAELAAKNLSHVYKSWDAIKDQHGTYDLIVLSHILEHIPDIRQAMEQVSLLLKKDGKCFVELPNRSGNSFITHDYNAGHVHFFSTLSLVTLFRDFGFANPKISTGNFETARYSDSIRAIFSLPASEATADVKYPIVGRSKNSTLVVWSAGVTVSEVLVPYFDMEPVAFFVDQNPAKQTGLFHGKKVQAPETIKKLDRVDILIGTIQYEVSVKEAIAKFSFSNIGKVLYLSDLLAPKGRED